MSGALEQLCASAERLRELTDQKHALLAEAERTNEGDRVAGLAALSEIDRLSARLRKAGPLQRWSVKRGLNAEQSRWNAIEDGRARRVVRMDALLDQALELARQIDALAESDPPTPPGARKRRRRSRHQSGNNA